MKEKRTFKMTLKEAIILIIMAIALISLTTATIMIATKNKKIIKEESQPSNEIKTENSKIDDWEFKGANSSEYQSRIFSAINKSMVGIQESATDSAIGFSTGGAKDVENFRENIKNGYFPISTDITYNGIFYDYSFDTGNKQNSDDLFSPTYSTAISKDPISGNNEYYMTVGLNSNIKESDFKRKKLNLVVVLDISGSMNSGFNTYYYDANSDEESAKSKMKIARESVNILIDQLNDEDRFGMILFDDVAYLGKPLSLMKDTDIDAIKNHILEIEAYGGTNFESGYTKATELYSEYLNVDSNEYENRIIVITDAMPNIGDTTEYGLLSYVNKNSENGIYTTFIGVGVDFNTQLIERISNTKGANYYSVHSSDDFKKRMGEQFEYMVTPLVFDLELKMKSEDFEIISVYGSDTVNKETGDIVKINTLFPSKTNTSGEVKGGIVLLKIKKKNENASGDIELDVLYKDREGKEYNNTQTVKISKNEEYYENTGIRKAIVLTRYVNAIKNWILYERSGTERFVISEQTGIFDCNLKEEDIYIILGEHERTSVELNVSYRYKNIFDKIKEYIIEENKSISDSILNQEVDILEKLINK